MSIQQRFINHINELIVLSWEPKYIKKLESGMKTKEKKKRYKYMLLSKE
jgi:hypothetical protein